MDTASREQLEASFALKEKTFNELEEGIKTYERHIVLLKEYISGKRKHEFDMRALHKEVEDSYMLIAQLRVKQMDAAREVDNVRQQIEASKREKTRTINIQLEPKRAPSY